MEELLITKTASRGIAIAPAYCYRETDLAPEPGNVSEEMVAAETKKFDKAQNNIKKKLEQMAQKNELFAAHREIAGDLMLRERVYAKIREDKKNVQQAVDEAVREIAGMFDVMEDPYMRERAADVRDVGRHFLAALKDIDLPDLGSVEQKVIVAAQNLYPSDMAKINEVYVKGILTEEGGITSHVSIMAKSRNIPILVGVKGILKKVRNGMMVCMDAERGTIVLEPEENVMQDYSCRKAAQEKEQRELEKLWGRELRTKDGRRISLCANAGSVEEVRGAAAHKIDGVGLFRSEFVYMGKSHFPTEEEQFLVYRQAAELVPQGLTIRTLDIGGDKLLSYFPFEREENPALGWCGIRVSLERKSMFKEQIRAILRAGAFGRVRMMFPMMISLDELREAKKIVKECKAELLAEEKAFDEQMEVGMMIETPASVLMAEEFAEEADFFSIGTNDLTQYLLAVDRGNERVAYHYDFMNPAVLRAVRHVIEAGHRAGIRVSMCGEMAGDLSAVPILLEMGLDEFSVSVDSLDYVKKQICMLL